ncbi:hypothetical protein [Embleya sp. MST-111070]|uniref:hypothetical protein n=1 Tax=Embleya sp. MST-111070 TaxID=3398231 RepID=UPI003F7350BF
MVDFGAVGRDHTLGPALDNNTAVARRLRELTATLTGIRDDTDLEIVLRVALECADSVLKLAFLTDSQDDPRLIAECKRVLDSHLNDRLRSSTTS